MSDDQLSAKKDEKPASSGGKANIPAVPEVIETEPQRVSNWRALMAESAGADPETIEKIAATSGQVDLTEWLTLVKTGCDPEMAFKILEPL